MKFLGIEVQDTVFYIIAITLFLIAVCIVFNMALKKYNVYSKPKGLVLLAMMGYDAVDGWVKQIKNKEIVEKLSPYIATVFLYVIVSNIAGLFALKTPTSNFSVTISLAAITVVLIEYYAIKTNGLKRYVKGLFEPLAPFVVVNIISKVSTLASLSLRLFGNIISGSIIMELIYQMLAQISNLIPVIGKINPIALVIAPVLHFYFDLFSGYMQAFLFVTLSIAFINKELPEN